LVCCEQNIIICESPEELAKKAEIIFLSLPTSREVAEVSSQIQNIEGRKCNLIIDTTSGDPTQTRTIGQKLNQYGINMVDCPVSGGPAGAANGTVTAMFGGDEESVRIAMDWSTFAKVKQHVGPLGSGHAVKVVNNILNCTHLLAATEGLLTLQKFGVEPQKALDCINFSSGRSLQTEVRIPNEVLTRDFNYGFKVGLMAKDCGIAQSLQKDNDMNAAHIFPIVQQLVERASQKYGFQADYTHIAKLLEDTAGMELHGQQESQQNIVIEPPLKKQNIVI